MSILGMIMLAPLLGGLAAMVIAAGFYAYISRNSVKPIYYRAVCDKCGHVDRERHHTRWLDPFFLSERCNKCGNYKSEYSGDGWQVEAGRYVAPKWWKMAKWTPLEDE